jgi:hypothetical protein
MLSTEANFCKIKFAEDTMRAAYNAEYIKRC